MIRKAPSAAAFRQPKKPKIDAATGLRSVHITRFWQAANDKHCPEPRFTKASLAAEMRRRAHQVTPAGTLWRCEYCRHLLAGDQVSFDHRDPVSMGGPNTLANMAICCETCNREKGAMTANDYALYLKLLAGELFVRLESGKFEPAQFSGGGASNIRARLRAKPSWRGPRG